MARRVLIIMLVLVVTLFVYLGYNSYDAKRAGADGDVFSRDSSAPGRGNGADERSGSGQTIVYPPMPGVQTATSSQSSTQASQPGEAQHAPPGNEPAGQDGAPPHDTISANPPNGMVFSGTGKFQLYRQGSITWRVNTDTGQSCILFATDEEWRKPRVYQAGCGSR